MLKEIAFKTEKFQSWKHLSSEIQALVDESGVKEGVCHIHNPHSTAGIFVNSYLDPMTPEDILYEMNRLVPTRVDFFHQFDTPTDASAHIKSVLMGNSLSLIIHEGKLLLGGSQGVIFAEFDGPRDRKIIVKMIAD
ncbi:MAG: secondary thiamine-phosphate synthase enzyme YjbQ [Anaerolineaceae bacterium]|nr:secondary thiamine-phosphate synthase enzyme YjbQ [Anaerolineaceae bacterium]